MQIFNCPNWNWKYFISIHRQALFNCGLSIAYTHHAFSQTWMFDACKKVLRRNQANKTNNLWIRAYRKNENPNSHVISCYTKCLKCSVVQAATKQAILRLDLLNNFEKNGMEELAEWRFRKFVYLLEKYQSSSQLMNCCRYNNLSCRNSNDRSVHVKRVPHHFKMMNLTQHLPKKSFRMKN